jgi:outer membrane protein with beta-barrel domain
MRRMTVLWGVLVLLVSAAAVPPAAAEWFVDVYGGGAFTGDVDVTIRDTTTVDDRVKLDDELTGGGRLGYWFDTLGLPWLGAALDVSYFAPAGNRPAVETRLEVLPISMLVMFRAPLFSGPGFPHGRLQPYLGAGPSLFVTRVKIDAPSLGERLSESQLEVGGDLRGGVAFMFTPNFGVFVEGRYTFFSMNPGGRSTEFDVETVHALGGVTLRW